MKKLQCSWKPLSEISYDNKVYRYRNNENTLIYENISIDDFMFTDENIDKILQELKYKSIDDVYINLGNNKLPVGTVINIIVNETSSKEEIILKKVITNDVENPIIKNDIIVKGIEDIKVNVASCCRPIPGDRIVGYITKGNGITVHRMVCPNVSELEERLIDVNWNSETTKKYPTNILIHAMDSKNILLDIISKTSNTDITVQSINTVNSNNNYIYDITVLITDKDKLMKFINDIRMIPNIIDVERVIK